MTVEFDRRCGTLQTEDCLQLYIPASSSAAAVIGDITSTDTVSGAKVSAWWPVLRKFHGTDGWPTSAMILPGISSHVIWFMLQNKEMLS